MKELKRFIVYLRQYRKQVYWGFVFVTISNICSTYLPRIVGKLIDTIQKGSFHISEIYEGLGLLFLLTVGSGLFMYLTRKTIIVVSRLVEYDLRRDYLTAIELQSNNFYNSNSTGSLMAYATNDIPAAREFLGPAIMYGANTITTFSFALVFMLSINPMITSISLIPLPLIAISTYYVGKKVHLAFKNVQEQFSNLTTQAQETFSGIRVVRSYVREEFESDRFRVLSKDYVKRNLKLALYQSGMMPVLMVLVGFSQIIVLGYGGFSVLNGSATLGELTQFFIYINLLIWPVAAIGWVTNLVQRAAASAGRLGKILDMANDINEPDIPIDLDLSILDIRFENVSIRYNHDLPLVLDNINLIIPQGSSLGIIGPVGSGKSSIASLIPRLYDITSGSLTIGSVDIKNIPLKTLRRLISYVSQEPFLFSSTIADNIRFGMADATEEEVIIAARRAALHDDIMMFPDKYDTMLGERGITLSGGQKQRLAIARAIIKNAPILILDDALSSVDTNTEDIVLSSIRELLLDRLTIIISHRISAIKNTNKIIVLDSGRIIERGTHDELVSLGGKYYEINEHQKLEEEIEML